MIKLIYSISTAILESMKTKEIGSRKEIIEKELLRDFLMSDEGFVPIEDATKEAEEKFSD
ncbi:hypothetical protein J4233_00805 [Candidatus Pacearchaeota archaeon]|nr:hypothetical protein [uncultured archaeon]AQS28813.1 hypothetical protein [uncultured archaeon]AQS29000.1 hypothetical protein [uncultured archaeon]MBS3076789.1 hypothetical protein [Candidatus Pacearchaeota archaeon]